MLGVAQKTEHFYQGGFYSQYVDAGFILTRYRLKPCISYYLGWEDYLLYSSAARYFQPTNMDAEYLTMNAVFQEIKIGIDGLGLINMENEFSGGLEFNLGYKWMNYSGVTFERVPLSHYSNSQLQEKYSHDGKVTFSITFLFWSNWAY